MEKNIKKTSSGNIQNTSTNSNKEMMEGSVIALNLKPPYILGASVIGPLHIKLGIPCQDACKFERIASGFSIIAVSDGLGSAICSDLGASIVTQAVIDEAQVVLSIKNITPNEMRDLIFRCVEQARKTLVIKATELQCKLQDLACTIIVVGILDTQIIVAHIGDGGVVAQNTSGLQLISSPGDSEYVNEVVPLTTEAWVNNIRFSELISEVKCLAVFTDGCQRAALCNKESGYIPFSPFFQPIFSYIQELKDLKDGEAEIISLLSSKKMSDNSDDDKTLILAVLD
jgi:hypothetical protein